MDVVAGAAEALDLLGVTPSGEGFVGQAHSWFEGASVFGGFLVGQAVHAATRQPPEGKRLHSLHAYFLRPVRSGQLHYGVATLREGRAFVARRVEASQDSAPVLQMTCSFTEDAEGYEYGLPLAADVPGPQDLPRVHGPSPMWELAHLGPTPPRGDGFRESTARMWMRVTCPVPDDAGLHAAALAYLTDITWTGGRPLHLDGDPRGIVSLDHALWIHRPPHLGDWLFYDVQSLVNNGGRGLLRGSVYDSQRRLVATAAQEMLIRTYETVSEGPSPTVPARGH